MTKELVASPFRLEAGHQIADVFGPLTSSKP